MGEFVSFWNLNQCVQMVRHEKNQGAVPAMGEVVIFCALQDERGCRRMAELVLTAWASAYCDEEFGVLDPVGSLVLKPDTHNRYNCSIGKKVRGMIEV
jgi:hypothetical protein